MLLVKTRLGLSNIHRIGIFADQFIPKDTIIWKFEPGYDLHISTDKFATLPKTAQAQISHYGYISLNDDSRYVLCSDDARYFNHSKDANTYNIEDEHEGQTVAARDIQPGEELTCNYD